MGFSEFSGQKAADVQAEQLTEQRSIITPNGAVTGEEGDWEVREPGGNVRKMTDAEFQAEYGSGDAGKDATSDESVYDTGDTGSYETSKSGSTVTRETDASGTRDESASEETEDTQSEDTGDDEEESEEPSATPAATPTPPARRARAR